MEVSYDCLPMRLNIWQTFCKEPPSTCQTRESSIFKLMAQSRLSLIMNYWKKQSEFWLDYENRAWSLKIR
ncbi:hypothetical protein THIOM_003159 [Candidatus Thiomargarita nelsonii]|uniref:Uncharacterized protein n=1 Tax=Candidatus Thiomargarita nelsonii TaxID=1003181 RepID=A0A176RZ95_9GAMM|nr:hypothetical protein THIOM_003159 [Candidatus Thiomargarita nelsonii]